MSGEQIPSMGMRGLELGVTNFHGLGEADGLRGEQATLLKGRLACLWMEDMRTLGVDCLQVSHL